jgi:proline iminopeptidase
VVADLAAVLDDCGVRRAVVYGSSYGTYLAQGLGVRHPDRVAGMVLDSPMLSALDEEIVRDHMRALLWDGARADTAEAARLMRSAIASGAVSAHESGDVAQLVYELVGPQTLARLLALRLEGRGRYTWNHLASLGPKTITEVHRFRLEFDLVGVIAFRETGGYAPRPDGRPVDVNLSFGELARHYPAFAGEPYDLPAELPSFGWPTVVVSGERDLRTPRPIAERIVDLIPDAVLVPLAGTGHSALDTHQTAALHVAHAVHTKAHRRLPGLADRIAALPRRGPSRLVGPLLTAAVAAEERLPRRLG